MTANNQQPRSPLSQYRRFSISRDIYVPVGAVKVADKHSDAVAYVKGDRVSIFFGRAAKPVTSGKLAAHKREEVIASWFRSRQSQLARKAAQRQERTAKGRGVEVGTILCASWGYDQTNVNFYRVTQLVGRTMATVCEVSQISAGDAGRADMTDKVVPGDKERGEPQRVVIRDGRATINGHHCHVWDGRPMYTSSYA